MKTALLNQISKSETEGQQPLRDHVKTAVENYFSHLDGHDPVDLYSIVLGEIEPPLLEAVLGFTKGNQSRAAILMGISRGTLRKKLKQYGMLD